MIQTLTHLFNCGLMGVSCNETEGFQGMGKMNGAIPLLLAIVVVLMLQLFIGKWLWNSFLVPAVSVVNPLKSVWDILALSVLVRLMIG